MEPKKEENLPLELTESMTERFLNEIGIDGIVGKSAAVAIALAPNLLSMSSELSALWEAIGVAYAGISNFIGCRNLKRFIVEYFRQEISKTLDKNNKEQMETMQVALASALQCKKEGQVDYIVAILSGVYQKRISPLEGEDLIAVASELTANEAACLREAYRVFRQKESGSQKYYLKNYGEEELSFIDRETRAFLLRRLASKGLLYFETGAIFGNDGKTFLSTEVGKRLFIELEALPQEEAEWSASNGGYE